MKAPPAPGAPPSTRSQSLSQRLRSLALFAAFAAAACALSAPAHAAPPGERLAPDPDPLDLFFDRAAGDFPSGAAHGGAFAVGVSATLGLSSAAAPSFGAQAFVQVPLDRFSGARRSLSDFLIAERPQKLPAAPAPEPDRAPVAPPLAPSSAEREQAPPPTPLLTPDLARGATRAACKAQKLDEADARLDALASRARTSALLPELRLRATRSIDESESLSPTEYDASRVTATGSTKTWLEARATFRLDRLVFADEEIAVERQRLLRSAERSKLVSKVLDLLDAWQKARAQMADPEAKPEVATRALLSAAAAEASLDVLTDGWFSKAIATKDAARSEPDGARREGISDASRDTSQSAAHEPSRAAPPDGAQPSWRAAPPPAAHDAPHPSAPAKPADRSR